jgi:molecular chaperone DnaK
MIFQTETQLKDLGDKLADDHKVAVEYALTELRMAHQSQDLTAIKLRLITSMLHGKLLLKQCMLKENKVKLLQTTSCRSDNVQDVRSKIILLPNI